ncbi:MAG: ABC transporter ATP-binding protein/permease [Candidatus Midichloria sp.]|nr:MAG: ABC transporter ATP-binding protein/permease [Candidatus Midichloria sp.]
MSVIKNAWNLGKGIFFDKSHRKKALALLTLSILFEFGLVCCQYVLSYWNNDFYTALQNFDKEALYNAITKFCLLVVLFITVIALQYMFQSKLMILWRKWMTKFYINKWLLYNSYFGINLFNNQNDNPDQRISEDINSFVNLTLTLFLGLLGSVITLASFFFMLWALSGDTKFKLFDLEVNVNGYFVWVAIIYSVVGTLITYVIGKRLTTLDYLQEKKEANFRFSLIRLRENAESIALYDGNEYEKNVFRAALDEVVKNFNAIIIVTRNLKSWNSLYINISTILPIAAALPKFFAKEVKLGGLMQIHSAFIQVKSALSFLITSFSVIASYKAVINRLLEFNQHVEAWNNKIINSNVKFSYLEDMPITLKNIELRLPNGKVLLENVNVSFEKGKSYLITGKNGSGKSILIKLIKGIWPFAKGEVELPEDSKLFFIPQKIYMPFGTLKSILAYPFKKIDEALVKDLLQQFNIAYLESRLDDEEPWSTSLSVGEQQKISILRAIIANPKVLIMDESTSALTEKDEELVFEIIKKFLPNTTIISVGHRSSLKEYHSHEISTECYKRS